MRHLNRSLYHHASRSSFVLLPTSRSFRHTHLPPLLANDVATKMEVTLAAQQNGRFDQRDPFRLRSFSIRLPTRCYGPEVGDVMVDDILNLAVEEVCCGEMTAF